jgi:AcrR family transcriptional regulator
MEDRGSFSTREAILRAAGRVVVEEGVSGMTLEAVACEAGVSKGGLLYRFPSKEALIASMIGRLIEVFAPPGGALRKRVLKALLSLMEKLRR